MLKKIKENYVAAILFALVVIEVVILVYLNLFRTSGTVDEDFAKLIRHVVEMGNNKTLFLKNWTYPSTAELDCSVLFATLVYLITGKMFIGFELGNLLNIALWIFALWILMDEMKLRLESKLLFYGILFTTFGYGILEYTNMMFFCAGQYVYKTIVPMMFVAVLLVSLREKFRKRDIVLFVLYYFLLLLTSVSSGTYVPVCGMFPVLVCLVASLVLKKDLLAKKKVWIQGIASVLVAVLGVILGKALGLAPASSTMSLRVDSSFTDAFVEVFNNFFWMFRVSPAHEVAATSLEGIGFVIRWVIVLFMLMALAFLPKLFAVGFGKSEDNDSFDGRDFVKSAFISIFVWNFFILVLTTSTNRYHLIGAIPMMLLAVLLLEEWVLEKKELLQTVMYLVMAGLLLVLNFISITVDAPRYYEGKDAFYIIDYDYSKELLEVFENYDVNTVFFVNDTDTPEGMRIVDTTRTYETYFTGTRQVYNCDFYLTDRDRAFFGDKNIIVCFGADYDTLEDYIKENYVEVANIRGFMMLYSEHNPIDGISYIAKGVKTIDLPTTYGYSYDGSIDENGYLHTSEPGNVLVSPEIEAPCGFDWELEYELPGGEGSYITCDVYCDEEYLESHQLTAGETSVSSHFGKAGSYKFVLYKEAEGELVVKEMHFNG